MDETRLIRLLEEIEVRLRQLESGAAMERAEVVYRQALMELMHELDVAQRRFQEPRLVVFGERVRQMLAGDGERG